MDEQTDETQDVKTQDAQGAVTGQDGAAEVQEAAETGAAQTADEKIADLEKQVAELKEQYLRKAADFDNYRKRMIREKQEAIDFANQNILLDLIQTLDDFDRALKAAADSQKTEADFKALCEGVSLIETQLLQQLETKWGLKRFESAGEPFDPSRHEALMSEAVAGVEEPKVAEDFMKGYTLKDRVIRPAKVKVSMPAS